MDINKNLEELKNKFYLLEDENQKLKQQVLDMKDELYKDKEIAALQKENEKLSKRCRRFGMFESDYIKMMSAWEDHLQQEHKSELEADKKGLTKMSKRPSHRFEFYSFAECDCYSIVCGSCKKSVKDIYY